MAVGQSWEQVAPLVPVLRPAVQAEDHVVSGARFGDVEVESARPYPTVANAFDVGRVGHVANLPAPLH